MGCESTDPDPKEHQDIIIYQTGRLQDWCYRNTSSSYTALKRAKTYTEGAFDRTQHTCSVEYRTEACNPDRDCYNTFEQEHPCFGSQVEYNHAGSYFFDWVTCGRDTGDDATLLLSYCDGTTSGGRVMSADEGICWALTGKYIAQLPSTYYDYGSSNCYDGMETALHELGHCFMQRRDCADPDHSDHHYGNAYTEPFENKHYLTPMGIWNKIDPDENACCKPHETDGTRYYDMTWSECSIAAWGC